MIGVLIYTSKNLRNLEIGLACNNRWDGLPNWVSNECTLWSLARVFAGRLLSAVRVLARRVTVAGS